MSSSSKQPEIPPQPQQTQFKLKSPRGANLATRAWFPKQQQQQLSPNAIVLVVHGGGWHSGYFDELGTYLANELGVFVGSYDQVGCGYSDREPGTPDSCNLHYRDFDDLVEDLSEAVEWAYQESGCSIDQKESTPLFLLGESFGCLQVLSAALQTNFRGLSSLKGLIVLGGVVKINPAILPPSFIITILRWLAPYYPRTAMPATDTSSTFDEAFGDKKWAAVARSDPRVSVNIRPTLAAAANALSIGDNVMAKAPELASIPLLAVHGKNDCRALPSQIQEFVDKAGPSAKLVFVDTDGHQLLQDKEEITTSVKETVKEWIAEQLNKS